MLDKIVEACRFLLNNYPGARECKSYLDSRLSETSQELFQFGYFPGIANISLLADLVGEEVLRKEKLLSEPKNIEDIVSPRRVQTCYFEDNPLIMPFRNPYGQSVGLVGRNLLSDEERSKTKISKYKNTGETPKFRKGNLLFGLYENKKHILDRGCVFVVEGQFDVIKASEIGFRNIVALGNCNMTSYQFSVISRYSNDIRLLLDNDGPGQKGRERIIHKFGQFANIQNFYLPDEYKDIDELIAKTQISDFTEIPFLVKG
jgi:DNA primase catalytic core